VQLELFDVMVPAAPIPVVPEDRVALICELHLTNLATEPLLVQNLQVTNPDNGKANCLLRRIGFSESITLVGGSVLRENKVRTRDDNL
jgi:hypothetical protein